jgi:hypothetical protein
MQHDAENAFAQGVLVGFFGSLALLVIDHIYAALREQRRTNALLKRAIGRYRIAIDLQTFTIENAEYQSTTKWRAFVDVSTTRNHMFLSYDPYTLTVIPRNAFATEEEADQFFDKMRSYHYAATQP